MKTLGGPSGRLVWTICCFGRAASSSSVSLSHTCTTTLGVDSVPACSSYFSPGGEGEEGWKKKKFYIKAATRNFHFVLFKYLNVILHLTYLNLSDHPSYFVAFSNPLRDCLSVFLDRQYFSLYCYFLFSYLFDSM